MSQLGSGCRVAVILLASALIGAGSAVAEEASADNLLLSVSEGSRELLSGGRGPRTDLSIAALMSRRELYRRKPKRMKLDLSPIVDRVIHFVRATGIPLVEHNDQKGQGTIAVSASFSLREDLPAVNLHIGERAPEPLGAFYPPEKGLRWAVVYPFRNLTFRLEGGDDSEFGYLAIAGLQWKHSRRPIVAGLGVPMFLNDSEGDVGVIFQLRLKLN